MLGVATSKDAKDVEFKAVADLLKNNQLKVWKKKYEKLEEMKEDLEECQNTVALFEAFDRGDKPDYPEYCASENCVAKIYDSNVPFEAAFPCQNCSNYFHHCCVYRKQCPVCSNKYPPEEVSLKKIDAEKKKAEAALKKLQQQISNEEKDVEKFLLDHKLGPLGKCFEAVLQKHGGTKKAFFQAYTGQQLLKMGNSLDSIIDDLPKDITDDPYFKNIATAFNKFLDIKFLLNSEDDFSSAATSPKLVG
uniref:Uncharacterized protein n=1 Tax=Panagrolaimus davidi TaxID=227884 RepID=A0A914PQ67_9BILA